MGCHALHFPSHHLRRVATASNLGIDQEAWLTEISQLGHPLNPCPSSLLDDSLATDCPVISDEAACQVPLSYPVDNPPFADDLSIPIPFNRQLFSASVLPNQAL